MEKSSKSSSGAAGRAKKAAARPKARSAAPRGRSRSAKASASADEALRAPEAADGSAVARQERAEAPVQRELPMERSPEPVVERSAPEPERPVSAVQEAPAPTPAPSVDRSDSPAVFVPAGGTGEPTPPAESGGGGEQGGGRPGFAPREFRGRDYWKQLKKEKRNRQGKPWHPGGPEGGGGGGGGGGRGPQHPPQPPPPSLAPRIGDLPDPARFADLAALDALAISLAAGTGDPIALDQISGLPVAELAAYARRIGCTIEGQLPKRQIIAEVLKRASAAGHPLRDRGWLDLTDRGHGFVVHDHCSYRLYPEDAYLPESLIRRYGLKRGHEVQVLLQPPVGDERCPSVVRIDSVMGGAPEHANHVTPFEELVPYYPLNRILLEAPDVQKDISMRTVDLLTPVGFGQRGLIVAPPRTGKTVLLQNIANSVSANFPEVKLILLLIDERPEEVTDFRRHTKGEVVSSTFDESPESHIHCAEMVGEKARRLVERGEHVVILLDSITRLARAYNALASNSGKIMSGGMEATALQRPKRFFGAARNIEGGGSLTILASALIDTGSRMDEIIFEEFKGTGNMELHLDRGLSDKRIFPAINMLRSGTRKEELIYHPDELQRVYGLRRTMQGIGPIESMEMLIQRLRKTKSNAEFLMSLAR
jgi:transcription termination factor Rho